MPARVASLLLAAAVVVPALAAPAKLEARVDPRVELLSIVFRLAGNPEYNMDNSKSPYADDVEKHFGKFRDHDTVQMARRLRSSSGISYDAVMSLAVHLSDDMSDIQPRTPLDPRPDLLESRWTAASAKAFIAALNQFAHDTDYAAFLKANESRYAKCGERLTAIANRRDFVGWFDDFFGERPKATFSVIVGMLNGGGNYGVSMRYADGREEITPVIGVYKWDAEGLPAIGDEVQSTIVHEFCHAYTNAYIDRYAAKLTKAGDALFSRNAETMKRQAYGNGLTVLRESLVRACVTRNAETQLGALQGNKQAIYEMGRGFKWTRDLAALLGEYEKNRTKYKTFDDFMPRVIQFCDDTAANYDALLAKFPRVVSMTPANGASDVDPALTPMVITFSRPMTDGSWSITGGGPEFPKLGTPTYDAEHKVLTVPVTLEAGKRYHFGLNGGNFNAFITEDGYPLEPVDVTFTTRAK